MGGTRRFKRNKRQKKYRDEVQDENTRPQNTKSEAKYEEIIRENADFEKYYKAQGIVNEEEWDDFLCSLRSDLPTAFRITSCNPGEAKRLLDIVKGDFFSKLINSDSSEETKKIPFRLPWYPNELGWQVKLTRKDIRRCEDYFRLHNFLISETETGCISRQETVSMIPPLALDILPHHKVLDMCAAPGSKTAQLVELLHSQEQSPSGFVIANDIDNSRCYMLVHQAKRLNSPCVAITNHDAANMPNFFIKNSDGSESVMKFDRVLCDVPCTGDGTMRKNPDIWLKWNAANGNNLHGVQNRILKRGLEMLQVGGKLVYSTCSFNPVENEAVIHRMLVQAQGSIELEEFSERLPGLKFKRGVSVWKPASKDVSLYENFDQVDEKWHTQVRPQMFPPSQENNFNLHRCLRVLPNHQDTGGFFVAVVRKVATLPWEKSESPRRDLAGMKDLDINGEPLNQEIPEEKKKPPHKKRRIMGYKEDPFVFFQEGEPIWEKIREFYDISGLKTDCLLTRCMVGKKKNIYYISPPLKDVVDLNQTNIKIINTGVKVFARCDSKGMGCDFRFVQEGLESIKRFVGKKRRIEVFKEELVKLLGNIDPKFPPQTDTLSEQTRDRLLSMGQGSCVIDYVDNDLEINLVGWKGVKSLRAYIPQCDAAHYLILIGADASIYEKNKFKKEEKSKGESYQVETSEDVPSDTFDKNTLSSGISEITHSEST